MVNVLIFGAGSIGNHLSYACRVKGWSVNVFDTDKAALTRMKEEIYPSRYEIWDKEITLLSKLPSDQKFDVVIVGTPPDTHIDIANMVIPKFLPKVLLIEKPLCEPGMMGIGELERLIDEHGVSCLVGFNHNLTKSVQFLETCLNNVSTEQVRQIEINWLENWAGIFAAHPWLDGPRDSYLGFTKRGGGACHEHSHAVALGVHVAAILKLGDIKLAKSSVTMVRDGHVEYDEKTSMTLETTKGIDLVIKQDVLAQPAIKELKIISDDFDLSWHANVPEGGDLVKYNGHHEFFPKTRKDDFQPEINHIDDILAGRCYNSPIRLSAMLIVSKLSKKCTEKEILNAV